MAEPGSLGRPTRGHSDALPPPPANDCAMGVSLSYASFPRRHTEDGQVL